MTMKRSAMSCWLGSVLCATILLAAARVHAETPEALHQKGVLRFKLGEYAESLAALNEARRGTRDPKLLAQIHLYIGLNQAVLGDSQAKTAQMSFTTALTYDPTLRLDPNKFKRELVELVEAARSTLNRTTAV
jgi:tetratricopeptide (TPR) repeat protein